MPKPPVNPMLNAAMVLAMAKSIPSVPLVNINIDGSIKGEASQNAITGASGTPIESKAAISGITPQEQKGDMAPPTAARKIMVNVLPRNAAAIRLSAPVAFTYAAIPMEASKNGST